MSGDAFCILPWIHLEVVPEGEAKICCVAREAVREGRTPMNLATHSLDEMRRSRYMQSVRKALADGRRIPVCTYCWDQEKRGERSQREFWNQSFPDSTARVKERIAAGGDAAEPEPLEYLQLSVGNKCNLACRMCNASYSSRIEEDPVHLKWAPHQDRATEVWTDGGDRKEHTAPPRPGWVPGTPWFEQPMVVDDDLMGAGHSLQSLYVTGGEPLMNPSFDRLLDEYVSRGHAQHMTMGLNTNLFHNEARLAKALESFLRFRYCNVAPSIDGHGAVYEYIRYPARWPIVDRNIRTVAAKAREHPHLTFVLTTVAQAYNVFNLPDLMRYADELDVECNPHVLSGPPQLRPHVLPRHLRLRAAEGLAAYAATPGDTRPRQDNRKHATRLSRYLEAIEGEPDDDLRAGFANFTRELDLSRQQSLAAVAPELAPLLELPTPKPPPAARRWWPFRSA